MGIRSELLTALVRDILGPRDGPYEVMETSPLSEYLTGVLQPFGARGLEPGDEEASFSFYEGTSEDDLEETVFVPSIFTPQMDPRVRPSSIGLSFRVRVHGESRPSLEICATWARYLQIQEAGQEGKSRPRWRRHPRCQVLNVQCERDLEICLNDRGQVPPDRAEVRLHVRCEESREEPGTFQITIHLVNGLRPSGNSARIRTGDCIFQPQIRVVFGEGTALAGPSSAPQEWSSSEEEHLGFLYRDRPVLARGHLVSAVWRDVDPERPAPPELEKERPDGPPFVWVDGILLEEEVRRRFSPPDVRTEFVPLYAVHAPEWEWDHRYGAPPVLRAREIARLAADPDRLYSALRPLVDGYERWLEEKEDEARTLASSEQKTAKRLLDGCREALERMRKGLDLLRRDDDVRLSFAFANQAMALQAEWAGRELEWRPFQIAFILMGLESIANPESPDRRICDLLWVPTGGGKTEAYLGLTAFTLAMRRRRALRRSCGDRTGAGVSVISRYTLRLLTIQQFRRALAMVTACELLRVWGLKNGREVGWRPEGWPDRSNFLWGTVPFRAGLWVGGGLTPNRLQTLRVPGRTGEKRPLHGALDILKGESGEGEPAQILTCPACGAWLAIPEDGLPPGEHRLHLVIRKPDAGTASGFSDIRPDSSLPAVSLEGPPQDLPGGTHQVLTLVVRTNQVLNAEVLDRWWQEGPGRHLQIASFRASRPGYFPVEGPRGKNIIDFEIWCPAPDCPLNREWWCEGVPAASKDPRQKQLFQRHPLSGEILQDQTGLSFREVQEVWRVDAFRKHLACRVPVPALTVDEQVYRRLPSVVIGTVDKFARLAFEPDAGALFGNVRYYHPCRGYFRDRLTKSSREVHPPDPPDLILQDELHLIEGPPGSLAGLYETAVDFLCRNGEYPARYVASTATVREAPSQVQSLFNRTLRIFPPPGLRLGDRFFVRALEEPHPLDEERPGQLYAGVCAPGRGPLTPIYRLWACLLQEVFLRRDHPDADFFWTVVGYFNAIRELAGAVALYRQDIPQRIRDVAGEEARPIRDDRALELSSRISSTRLPALLESLGKSLPEAPDALFATSMFGTGVDVPRLSLMVVHGQPKTTSAYIQATGRVGRRRGALVVTFLRASRPRDLSHYELFCGYHRQLHRYVEPATVMPFSPGALDLALGPVMVALLRHMRGSPHPWHREKAAPDMRTRRQAPEVEQVLRLVEQRATAQPAGRAPDPEEVRRLAASGLDRWKHVADREGENLCYVEYAIERPPEKPVVLGDTVHVRAGLPVVFESAPQSMREVEDTIDVEIQAMRRQGVRVSQMVLTLGPGAILESREGPRIILRDGLQMPPGLSLEDLRLFSPELENLLPRLLGTGGPVYVFQVPGSGIVDARWRTRPFPEWHLCVRHQNLYRSRCPECAGEEEGSRRRRGKEAIRFVRACPAGHLDDVDWHRLVHRGNSPHWPDYYRWKATGPGLADIRIVCPICRSSRSLGEVYGEPQPCSGRFPEREDPGQPPVRPGCSHHAYILQRQASSLRVPEVVSLFTVPPLFTSAHLAIRKLVQRLTPTGAQAILFQQEKFRNLLEELVNDGYLKASERDSLLGLPDQEIVRVLKDVLEYTPPSDLAVLLSQEFRAFLKGAREGIPPLRDPAYSSRVLLEVRPGLVRSYPPFLVVPVTRLRLVTVQTGYRRSAGPVLEPGNRPVLVDVSIQDQRGNRWFPGYESMGEGLFITLLDTDEEGWARSFRDWTSGRSGEWMEAYRNPGSYDPGLFRDPDLRAELHPGFVAWHTFSHLLVRALSVDSGYSAPSIRERIYFEEKDDGTVRGGVLIYTTSRSSDGSLGGLLVLAETFDRVLKRVRAMARSCSADPLCRDHPFRPGTSVLGAACHACCLVSETSCEHRNHWLDRTVLVETGWLEH